MCICQKTGLMDEYIDVFYFSKILSLCYFIYLNCVCVCVCVCFLGPHLQHMEVLRLGVESELYLLAYTTTIPMQDPSRVCDLHHSSQQCPILNPLSKARDQSVLMDASQIH